MPKLNSCLYHGRVFHKRLKPRIHKLRYKICSFLIDLDELAVLDQQYRFFSYNRWNIVSFWNKDFADGQGGDIRNYIENTLEEAGITEADHKIMLLCYPRLWGFVFNPLSVYFCYDPQDRLKAVIYEVSNTFGQRHSYVIEAEGLTNGTLRQKCQKNFYVSPFIDMEAVYHFNIHPPEDVISVVIDQHDREGPLLKACFSGKRQEFSDKNLLGMILKYPLMTLKVVAGIHWEALRLWLKGIKLITRPAPPEKKFTFIRNIAQLKERLGND